MSRFDLSRLGAWGDLPFFNTTLHEIENALALETRPVFPPASDTFAALERCQPDATKVIILGQDPYHTPGKADGLAFSIPQGFGGRLDSLGNIFKEIKTDLGQNRSRTDLSDWADQGVMLLNTALSVPQGAAKGHDKLGWSLLVKEVLLHLADRPRAYILWGGPVQKRAARVNSPPNLKIESAHPSPLSAYRGFFGSRPFSQTNAWLQAQGLDAINWGDPEGP
ncbi:Uracil-DNA glycosylase [Sulfitobacter noctilucae]|uniref:uracil-DNA glycosylase n=1 Tax=Sulfitobacter noctilucae TaxID=1342302 RepID=UPI000469981A|nr:uracil-DNA glycosylase [Sulfitobacter noctilucae]KIN61324.1 Uracil-DNA glycosylase [Sulfitobacter noctilucae]